MREMFLIDGMYASAVHCTYSFQILAAQCLYRGTPAASSGGVGGRRRLPELDLQALFTPGARVQGTSWPHSLGVLL